MQPELFKNFVIWLESRFGWDTKIFLARPLEVLTEVRFWLENIVLINCRKLGIYSKSSVIVYSDASNIAAGACTVEVENKIFHKMWTSHEYVQSCTWRELKAIELALYRLKTVFQAKLFNGTQTIKIVYKL